MLGCTLALIAVLALPAFAQAAGTITVKKGGYRDTSTNVAGTYALGLSGAAFEYAAYASATDPRTLDDTAINALTWLPLCTTSGAAGTCAGPSLANGRYLVREKTAPAGWSVVQSAAWSGGSSGASPLRQYIADVTVNNNNPTAEPVPAGLGGAIGGDSSPASSIFVNRRDNRPFPNTCGLKVLLLLDKSGSIGDTAGEATSYANAAKGFVDSLANTPTSLKIASFNASASFVGAGTGTEYNLGTAGDRTTAKGQIDSIYGSVSGGTNWDAGMRLAATAAVDVVIFITDGNPTAYGDATGFSGQSGRVDLLDLTYGIAASNVAKTGGSTSAAAALTQKVLAVGVGSGITEDNLKAVSGPNKFVSAADTNPDYAAVTDATELGTALKAIANRLCGSRIHVRKLTDGDANPSQARSGWTFTAAGGTSPVAFTPASVVTNGTLASDVIAVDQIPTAGSASAVTVAETAQAGYSIAASQCAKGADSSAFPSPADGTGTATQSIAQIKQNEDWWCTFRNKKDATVKIVKDAVPNDAQDFAFTTTGLGAGFSLDDDSDATLANNKTITVSGSGAGLRLQVRLGDRDRRLVADLALVHQERCRRRHDQRLDGDDRRAAGRRLGLHLRQRQERDGPDRQGRRAERRAGLRVHRHGPGLGLQPRRRRQRDAQRQHHRHRDGDRPGLRLEVDHRDRDGRLVADLAELHQEWCRSGHDQRRHRDDRRAGR